MATSVPYGNHDRKFISPEPCYLVFDVTMALSADVTETVTLRDLGVGTRIIDVTLECTVPDVGTVGNVDCDIGTGLAGVVVGSPASIFSGTANNAGALGRDTQVSTDAVTLVSGTELIATFTRAGGGTSTLGAKMKIVVLVAREIY